MIDDEQKIEVAKNFAKLHPAAFAMWEQGRAHASKDDYYLTVFDDLLVGVYGECYGVNAEFDGDGFQSQEGTLHFGAKVVNSSNARHNYPSGFPDIFKSSLKNGYD